MTHSRAAVGVDRLPWLADEPKPAPARSVREPKRPRAHTSRREFAGWAVAAALLLAGGSYWLGTQSGRDEASEQLEAPAQQRPEATIRLPEPRAVAPPVPIAPTAEVKAAPAATVSVPNPSVRRERPAARRKALSAMDMKDSDLSKTVAQQQAATATAAPAKTPSAKPVVAPSVSAPAARQQPLRLWPSRVNQGASGRLVQIGAFGTRQQAKLGWRRMTRAYPAVGRLPAVVVEARNSRGRKFYRFQIGTTSQAHSEVLCQRMGKIRFSCAVVGLPWKAKVER